MGVIAKILEVTPRRVYQLSNEGIIPKAVRGRYKVIQSIQGYIRYLRGRAVGADASLDEAARASKARLLKARAEAQEMENAILRNEYVHRATVDRELGRVFSTFRARMDGLRNRAAPRVLSCDGIREVDEILKALTDEALFELSGYSFGGREDGEGGDPAVDPSCLPAPPPDDQRVGGQGEAALV